MKSTKYSELPLWEKLVSKIMIYYQTVWSEKNCNASHHKKWLDNFKEEERLNSLYLLSKFMFFGLTEIRELLYGVFRDKFKYKVVSQIRRQNQDTTDFDFIKKSFEDELNDTRFVSLGGASESGSMLLYYFRQVNNLGTKFMKAESDILMNGTLAEPNIKNYIFIDDFCGSGETAIKCNTLISEIKQRNNAARVYYYVLFATDTGIGRVKTFSTFDDIETMFTLDDSFKCFNDSTRYYGESYPEIDRMATKTFSTSYGTPLVRKTPVKGHPLGFDDGQLLIGFSHNTPDNTLPIFWSDNNWSPFFLRYIKKG